LAVEMFAQTGLQGDFLKLKETRALFRKEQQFPSAVIDRGFARPDGTELGILDRARERVEELVAEYRRPEISSELEQEMRNFAEGKAREAGLLGLPGVGVAEFVAR
jgi:trimethylamine:corrinoid methyltransferase-like protein